MKHEEPIKANHLWIMATKTSYVKNTKNSAIASEPIKKGSKEHQKEKCHCHPDRWNSWQSCERKIWLWIYICKNQGWCLLKMENFDQTAVSMMAEIEFWFKWTNFSDIYEKVIYVNSQGFDKQLKRARSGCIFSDGARLGIICLMHQSLIEIGLKRCFKRFHFSSRWITDAPLLFVTWSVDKKWQKLKCIPKALKDGFQMYGDGVVPQSTGTC